MADDDSTQDAPQDDQRREGGVPFAESGFVDSGGLADEIEAVLNAVTADAGQTVRLEPRVGGTVTFSGDPYSEGSTGTVLAYEPPSRLSFTWGPDELHLTLEPADGGCRSLRAGR